MKHIYTDPDGEQFEVVGLESVLRKELERNGPPPGYKPVRCSPCGKQLAWVKETVDPGMKMKAEDALTLEGEKILPHTRLPQCSNCGRFQIGVSIA